MNPDLVLGLMGEYRQVPLELEVIVAGVDTSGAHIYDVDEPGVATCCDSLGFVAIGSGLPHAISFLTEVKYSASCNLKEALWITYEAKRRSERAPGVGSRFTDIAVIDEDGIHHLNSAYLKALDSIHIKYQDELTQAQKHIEQLIVGLPNGYELRKDNETET